MEKLIGKAVQELEAKAKILKEELRQQRDVKEAIASLESKKEELVNNIKSLTASGMPKDLIDFYVEGKGRLYASKIFGIEREDDFRVQLMGGMYNPFYPDSLRLTPGVYKVIVLVLPQDIKLDGDGWFTDELGHRVSILRDC